MSLLTILTWLKNNWLPIACLILMAALFGVGYHLGYIQSSIMCSINAIAAHDAAEEEKQKIQTLADQKAKQYEADRTKRNADLATLKKELARAEIVNSSYNTCHAGADFVQLYSRAANTSSTGRGTAEPDK